MSTTQNSKDINASPETIYQALTDPKALEVWLVPGDMIGKVHAFDLREGGGYRMSLYYPESEKAQKGKTGDFEDMYTAHFIELKPNERILETIVFDSPDEAFAGEMTVEITLTPIQTGTRVTFTFRDIPKGIKPEDNEEGTRQSLEKLAQYCR